MISGREHYLISDKQKGYVHSILYVLSKLHNIYLSTFSVFLLLGLFGIGENCFANTIEIREKVKFM